MELTKTDIEKLGLEDIFPTGVRYELWALGYDAYGYCTDLEEFLGEFTSKEEAIAKAKTITSAEAIFSKADLDWLPGDYIEVRVETIRNGDLSNSNIDTVFSNIVPVKAVE